jgi:hypothetical protein
MRKPLVDIKNYMRLNTPSGPASRRKALQGDVVQELEAAIERLRVINEGKILASMQELFRE